MQNLTALYGPAASSGMGSAVRGVVQMMVDKMEDPAAARAALAESFDGAGVSELRIHSLGDGEQMAGLQVAALREGGDAVLLVMLLD